MTFVSQARAQSRHMSDASTVSVASRFLEFCDAHDSQLVHGLLLSTYHFAYHLKGKIVLDAKSRVETDDDLSTGFIGLF